MASQNGGEAWRAGLGTSFRHDVRRDLVRITAEDGCEIEVPGPDLREFLETLRPDAMVASDNPYEAVLDRARRNLLAAETEIRREREEAPAALAELIATPVDRRARKIEASERHRSLAVAHLALERSLEAVHSDLQSARTLAELGCALASAVDPRKQGGARVRNLQAYAESVRGNILRVHGDLRASERAFSLAREYLSLGDPTSEEADEVDLFESSLLRDRRDFAGALALLNRVIEGLLEKGQTERAAEAHFRRAIVLDEMSESAQAIESLAVAASLTADRPDEMLSLSIRHSWIICLARQRRIEEAREVLVSSRPLYAAFSSPLVDARRYWVEGIVALEADEPAEALKPLRAAREAFGGGGYTFDLALVSLDLAAALLALGRAQEARVLAESTYRFTEAQEVHPDALAALAVFRQAALRESLTRDLLASVARRLQRAPSHPPAAS